MAVAWYPDGDDRFRDQRQWHEEIVRTAARAVEKDVASVRRLFSIMRWCHYGSLRLAIVGALRDCTILTDEQRAFPDFYLRRCCRRMRDSVMVILEFTPYDGQVDYAAS